MKADGRRGTCATKLAKERRDREMEVLLLGGKQKETHHHHRARPFERAESGK